MGIKFKNWANVYTLFIVIDSSEEKYLMHQRRKPVDVIWNTFAFPINRKAYAFTK